MRSLSLLAVSAALVVSSTAVADEPAPADSTEPAPPPTPAPPPVPAPDATPTPAPPPDVTPAPPATAGVDEDMPLRFRDMLRMEAARARTGRYFSGALGILVGGGVVAEGAVGLSSSDPLAQDLSYLFLTAGGIEVLTSVLGMIGESPIERLYTAYAPFAEDKRYTADQRLREGEDTLRQMAHADARSRTIGGITNLVLGAAIGGLAVYIWVTTDITDQNERILLGTGLTASSLLAMGSAIGQLWYQRGPAEVALEHWEAARGMRREARWSPMLVPVNGGFVGGLTLRL